MCRIVLAVLYAFFVVFIIVDIVVTTKNYYNFVSLSGIVVQLVLLYVCSLAPNRASIIDANHTQQTCMKHTHIQAYKRQIQMTITRSHPELVGDMLRVTLNFDLSKIPFVLSSQVRDLYSHQKLNMYI